MQINQVAILPIAHAPMSLYLLDWHRSYGGYPRYFRCTTWSVDSSGSCLVPCVPPARGERDHFRHPPHCLVDGTSRQLNSADHHLVTRHQWC